MWYDKSIGCQETESLSNKRNEDIQLRNRLKEGSAEHGVSLSARQVDQLES